MAILPTLTTLIQNDPTGINLLLSLTLKSSLILIILGLLTLAVPRTSASVRHMLWAMGMVALLLLPLLSQVLPVWEVAQLPVLVQPTTSAIPDPMPPSGPESRSLKSTTYPVEPAPGDTSRSRPSLPLILIGVWMTGTLAALLLFAVGHLQLQRLVKKAHPVTDRGWLDQGAESAASLEIKPDAFSLLYTTRGLSPMTWGIRRPVIILPSEHTAWSPSQRRDILVHELAHVKRRDCLTQTLANLACILHWFNPLVWLASRKMLVERERACDDQVLLHGGSASDYAGSLLEIARSLGTDFRTAQISMAMARRSQIAGRLLAVLDPDLGRRGPGRYTILFTVLLLAGLTLPLAALQSSDTIATSRNGVVRDLNTGKRIDPGKMSLQQIRHAIEDTNTRFEKAALAGDFREMATNYCREAVLYPVDSAPMVGRREIRELFARLYEEYPYVVIETRQVERLGDMVSEIGTYRFGGSQRDIVVSGRYISIWVIEEGRWRILRDMVNI
ncbi:MAG: DUF4440 domain-containing protein [bacterium]|nr:DUF4440 domain-containing protein [bacterium]